jgi:hypothetical protein
VWILVSQTKGRIWYSGKVAGSWIKLYKKVFHNSHSWPNIILLIKLKNPWRVGHVACVGEKRNAYRVSVWTPERKDLYLKGRIILKWFLKIWCEDFHWILLNLDDNRCQAVVNTVRNPRLSQNTGNFVSGWLTIGSLRRVQLHGVWCRPCGLY